VQVLEGRVVQVTVAVDDHLSSSILNMPCGMLTVVEKVSATREGESPRYRHVPATVMRPMSTVGAAVRSRKTRSLPTASIALNISSRLPAMVISSTG
jgi:hypothetical protein